MSSEINPYEKINTSANLFATETIRILNHKGFHIWRQNVGKAYPLGVVNELLEALRKGLTWAGIVKRMRPITFGEAGQSDLMGCTPDGRACYIEIKIGKDSLRPAQKKFLNLMKQKKCLTLVATDFKQIVELAKKY